MVFIKNIRTTIILIIGISINILAQEPQYAKSNKYYKVAMKYYEQKDYDSLLINMQKALELRPNHPRILYNLAVSYVLDNKPPEAYKILRNMIKMGLFYHIEKDSDFGSLMQDDEFKKIVNEFKKNSEPINNSVIQFKYPEKDLIAESVAYDSVSGAFFLSSIHKRKIVKISKDGTTNDFSHQNKNIWSVFGIKVDARHRLLYACTSPMKQMVNFNEKEDGDGALLKFDIDSGKLLKEYYLDNKNASHILGDLTIDKEGNVYISDSKENAVYKLNYNTNKIEQIIKPGKFVSLQGLDLDEDNNNLYLADYALGLYRYNFKSSELIHIEPSENFVPQGIDGLYYYKNSLIAIQNGINPQRVIKIYLNDKKNRVINWKTLEANNPLFDEVTLGVINNNDFYFIANGQWNSFNKDGLIFSLDKLKEPVVLHIKL